MDVPDDITLQAPAGATTVENDSLRNEYGDFAFIKYWLPKERQFQGPRNLSSGEVLTNGQRRKDNALHIDG